MALFQNAKNFFLLEGNVNINSLAKFQVERDKNRRDIAGQNFVSKADLAGKIGHHTVSRTSLSYFSTPQGCSI